VAREQESKAEKPDGSEGGQVEGTNECSRAELSLGEQESVGEQEQASDAKEPDETAVSKGEGQQQKTIMAPPGSLGLGLTNTTESNGTVASTVHPFSVLTGTILRGDDIIAIDGEYVSLMNASEIGSVLALKIGSERKLTVRACVPSNGRQFQKTKADTKRAKPPLM
jgi:C-terminal processing protease CtpA/Prc